MAEQYVFAHLGFQLADARLRLKTPARQSQLLRRDQSASATCRAASRLFRSVDAFGLVISRAAMADRICLTNVGIVLHHTSYTIRSSSSEFAYPIVLQHTRFAVLGSCVCGASLRAVADKTTVVAVIIQAR